MELALNEGTTSSCYHPTYPALFGIVSPSYPHNFSLSILQSWLLQFPQEAKREGERRPCLFNQASPPSVSYPPTYGQLFPTTLIYGIKMKGKQIQISIRPKVPIKRVIQNQDIRRKVLPFATFWETFVETLVV